ncbi:MAG: hypothetical protein ACI9UQ_001984 [Candidatus Krumholzibacteriia bacterium]|jgi:hypothetical protein
MAASGTPPLRAVSKAMDMSGSLQIEKGLSTELRAVMADGQEICGRFFLADYAENHYGQENLLDVLNLAEQKFIPFVLDDNETVVLIQKSRIGGLQPSVLDGNDWPRAHDGEAHCWSPASIIMRGENCDGYAFVGDLKPEKRRLADLLNHGNRFFVFDTEAGPWIINKTRLNFLVPQS